MKAKSWKTTVLAVLAVLPQALLLLFPKSITQEQANGLSILFAAVGVGLAKDHNVSGNPPVNIDEPETPKTTI